MKIQKSSVLRTPLAQVMRQEKPSDLELIIDPENAGFRGLGRWASDSRRVNSGKTARRKRR